MEEQYKNYFKKHYKSTFSEKDIIAYRSWFYPQWRYINTLCKFKQSNSVLEIGSAMGGFYSFIKEKSGTYKGIELDPQMVKFSNKIFDTDVFINSKIEDYNIRNKYDYIFAFEVLEHLSNPIMVIDKMSKMLHKNGHFCGTSPYPYVKNVRADKTHLFVLHPENWKRLFLRNGFKEVNIYPMSFLPYLWRINKKLNVRLPFYIPLNGVISTCLIIAKK